MAFCTRFWKGDILDEYSFVGASISLIAAEHPNLGCYTAGAL
jgi:uncharacterized membrane protein YeiB